MMSKFDSVIAEAAYAIAGHGFESESVGSVDEPIGWNALVDVSATTLLNVGEDELSERFRAVVPGVAGALVWIRENDQGFVDVVDYATDDGTRSSTDILGRDWDTFVDYASSEYENF